MADFTQHWVEGIKASRHAYNGAPLQLELRTQFSSMTEGITLYLGSDELTTALVEAINAAVKANPAKVEDPEVEAA